MNAATVGKFTLHVPYQQHHHLMILLGLVASQWAKCSSEENEFD